MGAKSREAKARRRADEEAAAAEPVTLEWMGETFTVAEKVGWMPVARFAKIASAGVDSESLDGLVAIYDMLENCLDAESWARFQAHATAIRASGDDCMRLVQLTTQAVTARPTLRSSDSSDGPPATPASSPAEQKLLRVLEGVGNGHPRPDLQLITYRQHQDTEARKASA